MFTITPTHTCMDDDGTPLLTISLETDINQETNISSHMIKIQYHHDMPPNNSHMCFFTLLFHARTRIESFDTSLMHITYPPHLIIPYFFRTDLEAINLIMKIDFDMTSDPENTVVSFDLKTRNGAPFTSLQLTIYGYPITGQSSDEVFPTTFSGLKISSASDGGGPWMNFRIQPNDLQTHSHIFGSFAIPNRLYWPSHLLPSVSEPRNYVRATAYQAAVPLAYVQRRPQVDDLANDTLIYFTTVAVCYMVTRSVLTL